MSMRRGPGLGMLAISVLVALAPSATADAKSWSPEAARYGVGMTQNVPVRMADGTVLRADVYFPTDPRSGAAASGRFPVLLTQTPYGKESGGVGQVPGGSQLTALSGLNPYLIERGYIDVIADVRGTGASQGSWGLFDPIQGKDGATLVRWAARLPNASGRVGLLGASYMGIDQVFTAANLGRRSPLRAMFPIISANDIYRDAGFQGGIPDVEFGGFYLALTGALNTLNPLLESFAESPSNPDLFTALADHIGGLLAYHAAFIANVETGGDDAYDQSYWLAREPRSLLRRVVADRVPAFLVGGWFDLFQRGEPLNYSGLQNLWAHRGVAQPMRPRQRVTGRYQLLMGPWYHVTAGEGINMNLLELRWFDRWLKGERTGIERTKNPLHVYELGGNRYLDAARYPFNQARPTTLYLGPGGRLSQTKPTASDGADQLAFTGLSSPCGRSTEQWSAGLLEIFLEGANGQDPCAADNSTQQLGPSALNYTTAPFRTPTVVAGPIDATLYATSNRPNTEFVVDVEDVAPNSGSTPLTSGALLGSMRALSRSESWSAGGSRMILPYHPYTRGSERPVAAGQLTRFDVEVFPTFAELAAGHRLRITIASADTPHLLPTPTQAAQLAGGVYSVQHTASAPSFAEVPLAPASAFNRPCGLCR